MLVGTPDAGVGCAASIILALLVALLTKLHFTISTKWVSYDASYRNDKKTEEES